jgi:hypothetical protein
MIIISLEKQRLREFEKKEQVKEQSRMFGCKRQTNGKREKDAL